MVCGKGRSGLSIKALQDHVDDDDKVYLGTEKLSNETLASFTDINPKE